MEKIKNFLRRNKGTLIMLAVVLFLRCNHIFVINIVNGESMMSTLHNGQICIGSSIAKYERGDIVVARHDNMSVIKRVVGLPGEHVICADGVFYINGEKLEEGYVEESRNLKGVSFEVQLEEDEYFICGDNRANSYDSRYYGPIKADDVLEKIYLQL